MIFNFYPIYSSSFLGRHIVDSLAGWHISGLRLLLHLLLHLHLLIVVVTSHVGLGLLRVHDGLLIGIHILLVHWHGLLVGLADHWLLVVGLCDNNGGSFFITVLLISSHGGVLSHGCHSSSASCCHHGKDAAEEQEGAQGPPNPSIVVA